MHSYENLKRLTMFCIFACALAPAFAQANPMADFDDGTLQGWTPIATPWNGDPFGGILDLVETGGNPGGYVTGTDTSHIGFMMLAGPEEFSGDLSVYTEVRWDEFVFDNPQTVQATSVVLLGANGTAYRNVQPLDQVATWITRSVALEPTGWSLLSGSGAESFSDVLSNATLAVEFSTSITTFPTLESGIDNITLVPEPTGLIMLGFMGLAACQRTNRTRGM